MSGARMNSRLQSRSSARRSPPPSKRSTSNRGIEQVLRMELHSTDRLGHSAVSAQCPVCAKTDLDSRSCDRKSANHGVGISAVDVNLYRPGTNLRFSRGVK